MSSLLISLVIASFIGMLFINIFFRVRVLKSYKYLVRNKVQFTISELFNKKKLEKEVLSRYPEHRVEIEKFANNIKNSVLMAIGLIVLIFILGVILWMNK